MQGEYDRCGGHANAESERLRRNSSAGITRNMLTEPLYRVECVYTVATLKNSSDSSTNVDCKFLTQYQKKLDGANFRFVCGKGFYHVSDCPQSKKIA